MIVRIRRDRVSNSTSKVEELMKSISHRQSLLAQYSAAQAEDTAALHALMNTLKMKEHVCENIVAELYRPAGRATNTIDPKGFRSMVKDDKEFYSAVSVSVTAAKKVLPEKQLARITTTTPAKPGEETVRVRQLAK